MLKGTVWMTFLFEEGEGFFEKVLKSFFEKSSKKIKKRFDKAKKKVPNGELSHLWKRVEKLFFPLSKFFKVLERKKIKFEKS